MCLRKIGQLKHSEQGNIFLAIFGAVAMVGLLGASVMTFMKGPLSTSVKLTKMNTAENQMQMGAQVAVMATANQANNGDCDADGSIEPIEWRAATSEPHPINGGLVPLTLGINKKDPWGTEYGYCVWNHGTTTSGSGCAANMLHGTTSTAYPVVALISAGPDKAFTTTCRNFNVADVNGNGTLLDSVDLPLFSKALETDDDIITSFTYEEATGVSGGLWSIKPSDPGVAVINKSIESSGVANLKGGVLLPDKSLIDCSDITNAGVMAKSSGGIEICDGAGVWKTIGGGASGALSAIATCAGVSDAGNVRFNSVSGKPEFCDGTGWVPFALSSPTGSLTISPSSNYAINITGPCAGANCPYGYGGWTTFTVSNQGLTATPIVSMPTIVGGNPTNFEMDLAASTCDNGVTLAPANTAGNSCTVVLRARASGNTSYSAELRVTAGALGAVAPLYGTGTLFTCGSGSLGWGGMVVGTCTGAGGTVPGTGQTILQQAGCGNSPFEPVCSGSSSSDARLALASNDFRPNFGSGIGIQNTPTLLAYGKAMPAVDYCNNLVKDGYDNWYLPSAPELQSFFGIPILRSSFASSYYWTSDFTSGISYKLTRPSDSGVSSFSHSEIYPVRCARKHNTALSAVVADIDPMYKTVTTFYDDALPSTYTSTLNASVISQQFTMLSFNAPLTFSVSGTGTPQFRVNGGAWQTTANISPASTDPVIEIQVTSPVLSGQERSVSISAGTDSITWKVRTYNSAVAKNIFVTSTNYTGNLGGLNGANNICRTRANFAGLSQSGTYQALLATAGVSPLDNIGWNWGTLQTLGVTATVAASPAALVNGNLASAPNRNEFGAIRSTEVWSGYFASYPPSNLVELAGNASNSCNSWTIGTSAGLGNSGASGSTTTSFLASTVYVNCATSLPLYCVGPNPDLPNITCPGAVDATASKTAPGLYQVTVPGNCQVTFKMWGGAGGNDGGCPVVGGAGGYAEFSETPSSSTTYFYYVGGKGVAAAGGAGGSSASGFEGGAGCSNFGTGGAGASVLYRTSVAPANLIAVAGGGGGAVNTCGLATRAGGQSTNVYSSTSTAGTNANCANGSYRSGGGGGGYNPAGGGGGIGGGGGSGNQIEVGSGGRNWAATGAGISSSTAAGSSGQPGNAGDSQRPNNAGASWYPTSAAGTNDGAIVVIY